MRIIQKLCLLFIASLLITSCATLPKEQNGKGILSVYIDSDITKSDYYYVHYRFYYDDDKFFIVDPALNKGFALNLDPGNYMIKKIQAVYNSSGNKANAADVYIPFVIKADTITILNKKLKVWFDEKNGKLLQYWNTKDISKDEIEAHKKEIAGMKNGSIWSKFN
ncbi:MAG: hypothetical protein GX660_12105 [Clostridiaceae bacterium]|nr:hypothetical protein [Clostridiaceae bacterium]